MFVNVPLDAVIPPEKFPQPVIVISVKVGAVLKTKLPALPVIPFTDDAKFDDVIEFVRFFEPSVATSLLG